jgi:hypothetical protein
MEDELTALILAGRYERTRERLDHRNGIDRRLLVTELGATELDVPRRRLVPYCPSFLGRAARRTATVDGILRQAFLRGLSTRETAALAETLTGVPLSLAAVSRLGRALDARVAAFHRRPMTFEARYLLCDGLWVSVRDRSGRAAKRVILAAYGIDTAGGRELLDYRQATAESAAAWGSSCARSSSGGSIPRGSSSWPPTGPAGSPQRSPRRCPVPSSSAAEPTGSGTSSRRSHSPSEGLPARPALDLPGPHEAGRRRGPLALGPGLAGAPSPPRPLARARPRQPASGDLAARAAPGQPAHHEPARARLPRAPPPAAADRLSHRSPVSRPDPVRRGAPPQQAPGSAPARCFHTRVLTSSSTVIAPRLIRIPRSAPRCI